MKKLSGQSTGVVLSLLLLFAVFQSEMASQVIYVGPGLDINSIKYGISQASDGDTIIVKDGTYVEDIKVFRSVVLMAENTHKAVIGDGGQTRAQISVRREMTDGVVVQGFRFASGDYPGILVGGNNVDESPANCTIRNNLIENRKHGIMVSENASNTVLVGNVIKDCSGTGINHMGFGDNLITSDTVENCQGPGIFMIMDDTPVEEGRFLLQGNVIRNNGLAGVGIERPSITLEGNLIEGNLQGIVTNSNQAGIIVREGNRIINNTEIGIGIENATEIEIRGNIISGNGMDGISSHGRPVIENNQIEDNTEAGIRIRSGVALIKENDVNLNGFSGIDVEGGGDSIRIFDCRIGWNSGGGIMSASASLIKGNKVYENGGHGIYIAEGSNGLQELIEDTLINNMGDEVFICKNSDALVEACVLEEDSSRMEERFGGSGIVVEGTARIQGNVIRDIIDYGIHISDLADTEISIVNNQIERCGNGLFIQGPVLARFNQAAKNWNMGILIDQPAHDVTFYRNEICGNQVGIKYMSDVPDIYLHRNNIRENAYGIVASGTARLRSNIISRNDSVGIVIQGYGNDLGNITESDSGFNTIAYNGNWNIFHRLVEDVPAYYNWWGLSTADSIDATIRDDDEEPELGKVLFEPFLGEVVVGIEPVSKDGLKAYPNPFRGELTISLKLPETMSVRAEVVDLSGRIISVLPDAGRLSAGEHLLSWDGCTSRGQKAATGFYFILIRAGDNLYTRKVLRE